ncbi:TPA: transposase, partial [Escherichia coli]|nr:transposase [Escherichia coli]EFZ2923084.1 transposase [Shigella dysenteriae]EHP8233648.1 transposase [Escherichia coli]EHY5049835.1 transposase [Escherichia coli]EID5456286.1 transposase [Escherichia coli]
MRCLCPAPSGQRVSIPGCRNVNTVSDAAKAMDVGFSTMIKWVKQLPEECQGKTSKASPITPEQIEIRELKIKLQRIEMENEILKKA